MTESLVRRLIRSARDYNTLLQRAILGLYVGLILLGLLVLPHFGPVGDQTLLWLTIACATMAILIGIFPPPLEIPLPYPLPILQVSPRDTDGDILQAIEGICRLYGIWEDGTEGKDDQMWVQT